VLDSAIAFAVAAVAAAALTPLVRDWALRSGALDHALTSRKVHGRPIPRLGGVAMVGAFFAVLAGLLLARPSVAALFREKADHVAGLCLGGLLIAALGVWDDLRGVRARYKLLVQAIVAVLVYHLGYGIDQITSPFGPPVELGWLAIPFTVLWITGVINALNLIDGLDGLAGGVALIAVGTMFVLAVHDQRPLMLLVTAALAGSLVGFLRYNFNPASIFMGDTGSMFLGFVLAITAIETQEKSSAAVAMLVPVVALGLPIGDTLLSMARRTIRGVPVFQPDRGHIHHRLLSLGLSHRQAVLVLYGVGVVLGAAAIAIATASSPHVAATVVAVLLGTAYLFLRRLGYLRLEQGPTVLEQRRRNLDVRARVREAGELLRRAGTPAEIWRPVKRVARHLGAECAGLVLVGSDGDGGKSRTEFSHGFDAVDGNLFRARYSLLGERPGESHLELGWVDGRTSVDRDTEIAIELVCDHVQTALERVERQAPAERVARVLPLRRP
jgi:UDP-GlcNAc:undecaprenyl-phosphate GlcNAc-1-phosphate transferase